MIPLAFYAQTPLPNLGAGYNDFLLASAYHSGYGADRTLWTAEQRAELDRDVQEAYSWCLRPSLVPGENVTHVWTWSILTTTLTTIAADGDVISNGTFADSTAWTLGTGWTISGGVAVGTAATGNLSQLTNPLVANGVYDVTFTLASVTGGGIRMVCGTRKGIIRTASGTYTETITADNQYFYFETVGAFTGTVDNVSADRHGAYAYTLPLEFGSLEGQHMTWGEGVSYDLPYRTNDTAIEVRRQSSNTTGRPKCFAIRPRAQVRGTQQRQEVIFWPTPDAAYTLTYRYHILAGRLGKRNPFPLGGPRMAQLMKEACAAIGEKKRNGVKGDQWDTWMSMLRAEIQLDRQTNTQPTVGRMRGDDDYVTMRPTRSSSTYYFGPSATGTYTLET